ncbi:hypothetical protein D0894_15665 [Pseudomonas monteilii]|uniref:Uncharacterized protein n=2 Tax=Pseudomonas monteilii TaxID=76759 RepID=A0A399M758_9PSED|nr:hypothetical protein D0894_15665 [Pseudomonas monteilii]
MYMTSLRALHQSMIAIRSDMQQFRINVGAASFDCLFSTRDDPFVLAMTSRGSAPKFFRFDVRRGYIIRDYLGDMYGKLLEVLRVDGATGQRLIPSVFLEQLNDALPTQATPAAMPVPSEIVRLRPDIIEDRDKPYFDTWTRWDPDGPRRPSEENRHKTLLLLGREALEFSIQVNASSRWSATDTGRRWQDRA